MKTKRLSLRQEREVAGRLQGRVVPASGAVPHGGSDVRKQGELSIECKYTSKKSYSLKLEELQKIKAVALRNGAEKPLFMIRFNDRFNKPIEEVVVMPLSYYEELRAQVQNPVDDDEDDEDQEEEDEDE